jgi:hypothetical protein
MLREDALARCAAPTDCRGEHLSSPHSIPCEARGLGADRDVA